MTNDLAQGLRERMEIGVNADELPVGITELATWFANREVRTSAIEMNELANIQAPVFAALSVWFGLRAALAAWCRDKTEILNTERWNKILESQGLQFVERHGDTNWSIYRGIEGFIHGHSTRYRIVESNEWGWRTHDIKMTARNWIEQVMNEYRARVLEYHLPQDIYCLIHDEHSYRKMLEPVAVDCYEQLDKYPRVVTIAYVHKFACEVERLLALVGYNVNAIRTPKGSA